MSGAACCGVFAATRMHLMSGSNHRPVREQISVGQSGKIERLEKSLEPRVGVVVLIWKDRRILLGRRKAHVETGLFALPGGRLEFGETWEGCAAREVEEETGLQIRNIQFAWVTNVVTLEEPRPSHYVTIIMKSELKDSEQQPQNLEPDKCEGWLWAEWSNLPSPIFRPLQSLIDDKVDPFLN
ncbi:unnamed protein product [Calypogeia fissa]